MRFGTFLYQEESQSQNKKVSLNEHNVKRKVKHRSGSVDLTTTSCISPFLEYRNKEGALTFTKKNITFSSEKRPQ